MTEERIVGKGVERVDARAKVTGQTIYAGDIRLQGMHFGKIVFSPHPRARVLAIDTSAAGGIPETEEISSRAASAVSVR